MAKKLSAFDIALSAKQGKIEEEHLKGASKRIFEEMSEEEIKAALNSPNVRRGRKFVPYYKQRRRMVT